MRRVRRLTIMFALTAAAVACLASGAHGDTLALSPAAAAACPACTTPTGGAQVVNLVATLAPQDLSLEPPDNAAPPSEGYASAAERMASDAESLDQDLDTGDASAADDVELGIVGGLADSGAIRVGAALCVEAGVYCPVILAGTAVVFYIAGHSVLSIAVDGSDINLPLVTNVKWHYNGDGDLSIFEARGPVVHHGEWYLEYLYGTQDWSWMSHDGPPDCHFGPQRPHTSILRTGVANVCRANLDIEAYVRTDKMMASARNPVKRVDGPPPGSTTVPAPPAPSRSALADAISDAINDNANFAAWLAYELKQPGARDPISGKVIVPSCDGLTWTACRDQMTGFGFATPVKIEVADDATALAPDAAAGQVALVEGEKTGRDPDDVLGVAVMPESLMSPRTDPIPDIDVLVETETELTTESSGACDLSSAVPAAIPLATRRPSIHTRAC